jgi:UDP-N-acetylglucosamine 3-dehydrogenase
MVAFMKRFAPAYREMHRIITDADTFGTAIGFHGAFDFVPWSPHLDDAGWVRLVGIHMLDLLRSLFGEVVDVAAISNNAGPDLSMALALRFPRGVTGTMNFTALRDPSRNVESLSIHGEKGTAQVERGRLLSCRLDGHAPALNQLPASTDEAFIRGFVGEIEHFYACIRGGRSPESSAADNIGTTVLCDRIVAQVQSTRL